MKKSRKLQKLNVRQRQAVEFGVTGKGSHIAGPLLIIAGAGTGKTQALAHRVAHLIVNGVDPNRILLMTFTRRASKEMVRRANSIVNTLTKGAGKGTKVKMPWAGTFHAIGTRILRANAHRVGLNPAFTFLDEADAAELMNMARHQTGSNSLAQQFPSKETCLDIYSRKVNSQLSLRTSLKRHFPEHIEWKGRLRQVFKGAL